MRGVRGGVLILVLTAAVSLPAAAAVTATAQAPTRESAAPVAAAPAPSPTAAPALTLLARPAAVTAGDPVGLVAGLGIPGATLQLSRREAGDTDYRPIGPLTTGADGGVGIRALPRQTTTYRVEYAGDGVQWLPASAEVVVQVRPRVSFSAPERVYRGRRARLTVSVRPAHPGGTVTVQRLVGGEWVGWRAVTLDGDSRARTSWRADTTGDHRLRVLMAEDAGHLEGRSRTRRIRVVKPNPYNVPLDAKGIIVVDISQYTLRFYSYGRLLRTFPCVTGRPGLPTPIGRFRVYARGMWPGGPYGSRIMSYHPPCAIHGTNEPHLLSRFPRNFSHGCTRLYNHHAVWLYDHAPLGTPVWNVP